MAGERTYPILPCADVDEIVAFYETLGFTRTYLQKRPNPYAVVARDDIHLHFGGIDGFDPAASYGSVIIAVPDADALYADFAAGLRAAYGKLPVAGIPRILRPRKKQGTVRGFSVVDPGGNWLRVSTQGDTEDHPEPSTGLARVVDNASRQADARGREDEAIRLLRSGLAKYDDAPPADRTSALLYLAELLVRTADHASARDAFDAAEAIGLSADERQPLAASFDHLRELLADG